ncbi:DUF992 domain-containing protein [Methylocystis sp. L43]|uniref:DUF992 domain-containing protein n=1 Tax=unclassified Methylocystis TaxID=2625913 RepID=UPI0018C31EAD|nr:MULTISPECIES: DUF992 domain-containing protein [unclassified Methylocystis]MBG0797953.1 DUF992 domain-containing protein [Methylocystis sp. L43]MBG0805427.1 DUF992 domain-containing protein [Methylocystis sp. H15]
MLKFGLGRALSGVFALAMLAPASAFAGDRVGILQCRLLGNGISVLVENQQMDCIYRDNAEGAAPAHYAGALTKVGANVTINGPGQLSWGVVAATDHLGPGALAGSYIGPGVSAKLGVGGGGAALVGGSDNIFSLQPFNVQAGSGVGWTAGVESLTLAYIPPPPPLAPRRGHVHHHHHGHQGHTHHHTSNHHH